VVATGPQCPFLVIKELLSSVDDCEVYFKLPNEAKGVNQIQLLKDKCLLAYLSDGTFYLVDLNADNRSKPKVEVSLEIRIPGQKISKFEVD
jgi:hypothetical protein